MGSCQPQISLFAEPGSGPGGSASGPSGSSGGKTLVGAMDGGMGPRAPGVVPAAAAEGTAEAPVRARASRFPEWIWAVTVGR